MKKTNLPLLVVALLTSMSLWLLNGKIVEASGEGGNLFIKLDVFDIKPIETKKKDYLIILQQQREIEDLKSEIIKLEQEIELLKTESEVIDSVEASPFQYYIDNGKRDYFTLTAYTNGVESTGKTVGHPEYGITASGAKTKENHTIACPKSFEFGTEVYIPSLENVYTCEDLGGAIKKGRLDVFIKDLAEALEFGKKKNVEVYIVEE